MRSLMNTSVAKTESPTEMPMMAKKPNGFWANGTPIMLTFMP